MKTKKSLMVLLSVAASTALFMSGCGNDDGTDGADGVSPELSADAATKIQFEELGAPITDEEKSTLRASESVAYTGDNVTQSIGFTKLMDTAGTNNAQTFGLLKDYEDQAISFPDGSPYICNGTNDGDGSGLDHSSILQVGGRLFMVNQFECGIGGMYGMELSQDAATGALSVKADSLQYISQTEGFGGWVHCAGMTTPWNSHLGSEEYEPDAKTIEATLDGATMLTGNSRFNEVTKYFWKDENNANAAHNNNPYFYGWIPEVKVAVASETAAPVFDYEKHFSMGRAAWELAYIMPDEKTAYLSDDGTNVGFYMYVADTAQDLSAGALYAAKWIQTSGEGAGEADIMWVKLGHATDAEIKTIVSQEISFSDIFASEEANASYECPTAGFTAVNTATGLECLKLQTAADSALASDAEIQKAAAFLETRRYAAMLGATTEFRKEEGITYNPDHGVLYVAMSQITKGMEDGSSSDNGGNNDIRLEKNSCGAVYALDVLGASETATDTSGATIDSAYVVDNMYGVIAGSAVSYPAGSAFESYSCSVNGIANPDNVTYLAGENLLAIGEDTGAHPNDFVWALDVVSGNLTRILSTPYGSETTSPFWHKDVNGYGYLTVVTQHPFGEVSSGDAEYGLVDTASDAEKESFVGVVGPFDFIVGDGIGQR
jgi:secreted PhoX family phosphatase